jgi:3-dehydroquinate synthase
MAGGEGCKNVEHLQELWKFFLERKLDRKSLVLSIGGGATSDLVGFACATFMRGVRFIALPTTLLAQVDASIGGKTAINFGGVKNLVGSITQPDAIISDIDTLATLPDHEMRCGFAEIVKHGMIADAVFMERVTSQHYSKWSPDELTSIVIRSCEIKQTFVESDETEQGQRKALNFGHTIGHALEEYLLGGEVALSHGEAVSIGMHAEAFLSHRVGLVSQETLDTLVQALARVGLPTHIAHAMDLERLIEHIKCDKKTVAGRTRWSLLAKLGECKVDCEVREEFVREAIARIQPREEAP